MNVSLITYGIASLAYLALAALLLAQWRVRPLGPALLFAVAASAIWSGLIAVGTLYDYPPITLIRIAEYCRDCSWIFFLLQIVSFQGGGSIWDWRGFRWPPLFVVLVTAGLAFLLLRPLGMVPQSLAEGYADGVLLLLLGLAIAGLLLVEQLYRNAIALERWGVKYLCLGTGTIFAYDFFMYAEALLFRQLNAELWQARGIVAALVVPWLAIAAARNRQWRMDVFVSRHVVFHTVTLMGTGLYLLGMALIGYFIKYLGGSWGGVLQIGFLALSGALLFTLLFSAQLRARLRVFLSKHFFSYRYDYRDEWLRFTEALAALGSDDAGEGIVRAMAPISHSESGLLICRDTSGKLSALFCHDMRAPDIADMGNLPEWIAEHGWVIDLMEWRLSPDLYVGLTLPDWLRDHETIWLIVPLMFQDGLEGMLFLARTDIKTSVNWEDRDLLRTAGRQAAALLAQQRASTALVEARQFDAFNRLSAYVIHDLKNILAQQSLMVANARKHRENPAFIDDMISTVENSVNRMKRLMDQMRSGMRSAGEAEIELGPLLERCIETRTAARPQPSLSLSATPRVSADRERLTTVFGHLLQNAQEATPEDGQIRVHIESANGRASVSIADTGTGMSEEFVRERLFKPFESTKGLTGMGIGAFESREYVRQLGGDIQVTSDVGSGSVFTVTLPEASPQIERISESGQS
jgi:putative PEP-CTERM system histidine kinase